MKILLYKSIRAITNWNLTSIVFFSSAAKYVVKYCSIFLSRNEILLANSLKRKIPKILDWPLKLSSGKQNFWFVKIGGHLFIFIKTHRKPPCGYLRTSFSSLVFHQIVGFSPKTSHVKNGLRASRSRHDDNHENEKIKKTKRFNEQSKRLRTYSILSFSRFSFPSSHDWRWNLIEIAMWSSFHSREFKRICWPHRWAAYLQLSQEKKTNGREIPGGLGTLGIDWALSKNYSGSETKLTFKIINHIGIASTSLFRAVVIWIRMATLVKFRRHRSYQWEQVHSEKQFVDLYR